MNKSEQTQAIEKAKLKYDELCAEVKGKMLKSVELDYADVVYSYYELPISDNAKLRFKSANAAVLKIKRFENTVSVERFYANIDSNLQKYEMHQYREDYWNTFTGETLQFN